MLGGGGLEVVYDQGCTGKSQVRGLTKVRVLLLITRNAVLFALSLTIIGMVLLVIGSDSVLLLLCE